MAASYLEQYWVQGGTALRVVKCLLHGRRRVEQAASSSGRSGCSVKYEDIVDHPERELRRLCGFLGEDYDSAMLQYAKREDAGYLEVEEVWKGLTRQD